MAEVLDDLDLDPLIDDINDVLKIRAMAVAAWKDGLQTVEISGEGMQRRRVLTVSTAKALAVTRRCLKLMDPDLYGSIVRQSTMRRVG